MEDIYDHMKRSKESRQSHLDLSLACEYRGTDSKECRGILAVFLGTTVPYGKEIHCCHACNDGKCSNWKHLYWGTAQENAKDWHSLGPSENLKRGAENSFYGIPPWRNISNARPECWQKAGEVFNSGLNPNKRGFEAEIKRRFGLRNGPARRIKIKLLCGWNPFEDEDWIKDFGELAYQVKHLPCTQD